MEGGCTCRQVRYRLIGTPLIPRLVQIHREIMVLQLVEAAARRLAHLMAAI
jgi:hypothetical protein